MALSPEILQEYFDKTPKCKISGKMKKVEMLQKNGCVSEGKIFIQGEDKSTHFMYATFLEKGCTFDSYYKPFFESDMKIGNDVSFILEQKKYYAFDGNIREENTQNIPYCVGNKIIPTQNYYWGVFILIAIIISIFIIFLKNKKQL